MEIKITKEDLREAIERSTNEHTNSYISCTFTFTEEVLVEMCEEYLKGKFNIEGVKIIPSVWYSCDDCKFIYEFNIDELDMKEEVLNKLKENKIHCDECILEEALLYKFPWATWHYVTVEQYNDYYTGKLEQYNVYVVELGICSLSKMINE